MGNNYTPDININLATMILLFAIWMIILLLASYYVPRAVVEPDVLSFFSFSGFKGYLSKAIGQILLGIILTMVGAAAFLFAISMVMSYLISFLEAATNYSFSKIAIENIISFSTQVFYANSISAVFLNIYLKINSSSQKPRKTQKVKMGRNEPALDAGRSM